MLLTILSTTLLQMFCKIILVSKVIIKSIIDPDNKWFCCCYFRIVWLLPASPHDVYQGEEEPRSGGGQQRKARDHQRRGRNVKRTLANIFVAQRKDIVSFLTLLGLTIALAQLYQISSMQANDFHSCTLQVNPLWSQHF